MIVDETPDRFPAVEFADSLGAKAVALMRRFLVALSRFRPARPSRYASYVRVLQAKIRHAQEVENVAKERYHRRKAKREALTRKLLTFIDARHRGRQALFGRGWPAADDWREEKLSRIRRMSKMSSGVITELTRAELRTVGDLADYISAGNSLRTIAKIGPIRAEAIENAVERFLGEMERQRHSTEATDPRGASTQSILRSGSIANQARAASR